MSNIYGLVLSLACVVHCILMPVCLASLPSWGLGWMASPYFHQILAVLGVAIGIWALVPGWKRHRRHIVLLWAAGGLLVMNYAAFAGDDCCAATASESSKQTMSCCQDSCCAVSKQEDEVPQTESASMVPAWNWLWQHPTALGALCLAWAHCLNGSCSRKCCQQATTTSSVDEREA
ncbi:MerC domain-containing protein [Gimesia chilikensis]|nr:MerC domain-containing protein [Gimesia chilikensis]